MQNSNTLIIIFVVILAAFGMLFISRDQQRAQIQPSQATTATSQNCLDEDCLAVADLDYPVDTLPDTVETALISALDDEYKALATYEAVMAEHGNIRPFIMIARAEQRHITSLLGLFDKYGIEIAENPYQGNVSAPESIKLACQTGVDAEIANAALYRDELLLAVTNYPDITRVFTNLMNASEQKHLPAFERCN